MKTTYKYFIILLVLVFSSPNLFAQNEIQRVRIDFETPIGFVRHLLLGFTPDNAASDGFDYGYDAPNIENHPDDMNWMIDGNRYVIQGVGAFDENKYYPLGMFLTNSGDIKISLFALENFIIPINVYVYDVVTDEYTHINSEDYTNTMSSGEYLDRFYLTFMEGHMDPSVLSISENNFEDFQLKYTKESRRLTINSQNLNSIDKIELFSVTGQQILEFQMERNSEEVIILPELSDQFLVVALKHSKGVFYKKIAIQF
ncbi:MAG: hypothetical protein KJO41_10110 [Bacteroidia bacterium]|nr:hypothetical protein [Bacteroidia bacterium]MBT8279346.1 hypothetical protein [Bacteroidia bacterium]NNL32581.1 hypothetical protein [Flavobacteriaceae bacterium]RZW50057.1 MAG: hypothetical protein EX263_07750 [Flavobacteriaceae bacterium]